MGKINRETLKGYFGAGKKPTGKQFEDLVDSMLNIVDDGLNKSSQNGLQLSPLEEKGAVLEFLRNILDNTPLWKVEIERTPGLLHIRTGEEGEKPLLTLHQDGKINVEGNLILNGTVEAKAFVSNYHRGEVPADGKWHDVTFEEKGQPVGCRAYRVIAGCGRPGQGKYALLEATAMHCYGKHRRVSMVRSWFGMPFNRLSLRWRKQGDTWRLQIATWWNYGEGSTIHFQVSELWQDYYFTSK